MTDTPETTEAEFATVILTIDHTTQPQANGALLQKFVASTEDLVTSMLSLFDYYGEQQLLHSKATIQQFNQADKSDFPCFVFRTKENIQIVMEGPTFTMLVSEAGGNVLKATTDMLNTAGEFISSMEAQAGAPMPLLLFDYSREPAPMPEWEKEQLASKPAPRARKAKAA